MANSDVGRYAIRIYGDRPGDHPGHAWEALCYCWRGSESVDYIWDRSDRTKPRVVQGIWRCVRHRVLNRDALLAAELTLSLYAPEDHDAVRAALAAVMAKIVLGEADP